VHAYKDKALPENTAVQSITFDTIKYAKRFAEPDCRVDCVVVTYPDAADLIPPGFVVAPSLKRFVTDVAEFRVKRALPLLFDVLQSGVSAPLATPEGPAAVEFLVLTNSDIHLQPTFYRVLAELIKVGYDVMTVNRRTIDLPRDNRAFSPIFIADQGRDHPGFDCFVLPVAMLKTFVPSDACCGAGWAMRSLLYNLVANANRFLMLTRVQMTFHLGDDAYWYQPIFADYRDFNKVQAKSVVTRLAKDFEKAKRLADFIVAHEKNRCLNETESAALIASIALGGTRYDR
jgi:hypothetical protein